MQPPSLPPILTIFIEPVVDAACGLAYAYLFKTNLILTPLIFGISNLAHRILFHTVDKIFSNQNKLWSHKIYVATFTLYHASLIAALAALHIIGASGAAFLSIMGAAILAGRITWIYWQHQLNPNPV
jgi:hypothetical protein